MVSPLVLPVVTAAPAEEFVEPFKQAFSIIIEFFKLDWLEGQGVDTYAAVVRFALWIVTFTIINEILTKFNYFSNKSAKIIAFAFSAMAAIFMPQTMLILIGQSYAALFSMIFIGAIVFAGWRLGDWVEKQGGPGSRGMFIIIMLVLMWLVWLIQWELAAERKVPEMEWWIFGTIYNWFGTIAIVTLGYTVVTKGLLGGGGGAAGGGGIFGGGGGSGSSAVSSDLDRGTRDATKAAEGSKELHKANEVLIQLTQQEARLDALIANVETDAMAQLQELIPILNAIENAAKQLEKVKDPTIQQQYQQLLASAAQKTEKLLALIAEEDRLADQELQRVREQFRVIRAMEKDVKRRYLNPILNHRKNLKNALLHERKRMKNQPLERTQNRYVHVVQNETLHKRYSDALRILKNESRTLLRDLKNIDRIEKRVLKEAKRDINKELKAITDLRSELMALSAEPDATKIRDIRKKVEEIANRLQWRIQRHGQRVGIGVTSEKRVKDFVISKANIERQVEQWLKDVDVINNELNTLQASVENDEKFANAVQKIEDTKKSPREIALQK